MNQIRQNKYRDITRASLQHLGWEDSQAAIQCYWVKAPSFGFHWHYHPEYEITCVVKGKGTRMIGDHVAWFEEYDMAFLGSGLPHTWISDDAYAQGPNDMEVLVLQFHPTLFESKTQSVQELSFIQQLLARTQRGLDFSYEVRRQAARILMHMVEEEGFGRYVLLMELFYLLGKSDCTYLTSPSYTPPASSLSEDRLLAVCRFIHEQYQRPIALDEVASLANMNATAFCRFFKKNTGQTVSTYITDLRIGKAANLLIGQPGMSISEVAFLSGFNNQALFNRNFLKRKKMTPRDFRKKTGL